MSNGEAFLSLFVSDGAGGATRGGEGAELAIQAACEFVGNIIRQGEFGLSDALATDLVISVRERLCSKAEEDGLDARDFACTLLGLLSYSRGTLVLQIGDGGVVVDVGAGLELALPPMTGEYANTTYFVTDEDAVNVLATKTYLEPPSRVAAFSDGIQRLALNLSTNTPHVPFFEPLFTGMAHAPSEQEEQLHSALVRFLGSAAVNERTDDDKTLVLAVRSVCSEA